MVRLQLITFVVRTMAFCLVWGLVLVFFNSWIRRVSKGDASATIGGMMMVIWAGVHAVFSAVAGQNLIVGHSERRRRATHIITKEGVYWAAIEHR